MKNRDGSKTAFKQTTVDGDGVVKEEVTVSKLNQEPEFVKLYLADIIKLHGLSGVVNDVLNGMLRYMTYDNQIPLHKSFKNNIANNLDIKVNTVEHCVRKLVKAGILYREERGLYTADPHLFGKGKWQDIQKLRMSVTYDENGRMITVERT